MKKNRILVLSSLVSLIPLASISVVSCNKKKTEEDVNAKLAEALKVFNSNKDIFKLKGTISTVYASTITTEEQLLKYFDFIGKIEGITYTFKKAEPFKNDPTILAVTYELSYKTATKLTGTIYLKGFKSKIDSILPPTTPDIPEGEVDQDQNAGTGGDSSGGTGGGAGGDGGNTVDPTEGILTIEGSQLGATHTDKSVWTNIWTWGSNLSNNIAHYKFIAQNEDGTKVEIPNDYFKVQEVGKGNGYVYFTQRQKDGGEHIKLFNWMLEQLGKRRYDAIIVVPAKKDIKPSNPTPQPSTPDSTQPKITTFKLEKTWIGAAQKRAIVVNGQNLPSNWSKYKLVWKLDSADNQQKEIPSNYFRNSIYDKAGYQVFVLQEWVPEEFVKVFDYLLQKQQKPMEFFDLTLVEQTN